MDPIEVDEFSTVYDLHKSGKLDRRLRLRLYFLGALALIFLGIVLYDAITFNIDWAATFGVVCLSFLVGLYIFSRMFQGVVWNEEREVMKLGRIDAVGVVLVLAYVLFRLLFNKYIEPKVHTISVLTYASVFGIMSGRLIGMLSRIHRIHQKINS